MKHQGLLVLMVCFVLTLSVIAQQSEETATTEEEALVEASAETANEKVPADSDKAEATLATDEDSVVSKVPATSKAPRKYPIAAGVWYPGEPVPTEASRYYRVRCWPGCHSYGEWIGPVDPDHSSSDSD